MKTLALCLGLVLSSVAAPSFTAAAVPSTLQDLTQTDMQFLSTNLFMGPNDDLIKNLTPKQRDELHRLISSKKLEQSAKVDQVSQYLTNIWVQSLDTKVRTA